MANSRSGRANENTTKTVGKLLLSGLSLLGAGCSAQASVGGVASGASGSAEVGESSVTLSEPPPDSDHVRVTGTVEAITPDGAPVVATGPIAGAEVCLTASGDTTCVTTDESGAYAFSAVPKSAEPAELVVIHNGFATTVTALSVEADASHSLGVLPESAIGKNENSGVVLVRSLMKIYFMTDVMPGIDVDVTVGQQAFSATTDRDGCAVFTGVASGVLTAHGGGASTVACDAWAGNFLTTLEAPVEARAGVVTEMDVLCNIDQNDEKK